MLIVKMMLIVYDMMEVDGSQTGDVRGRLGGMQEMVSVGLMPRGCTDWERMESQCGSWLPVYQVSEKWLLKECLCVFVNTVVMRTTKKKACHCHVAQM